MPGREESFLLNKLRITAYRITKFLTRNRSHYGARYTAIVITLHTLTCSSEYIMLAICSFRPAGTTWKCPSLCTCILRKIQFGLDGGSARFPYVFTGAFGAKIARNTRGAFAAGIYRSDEGPSVIPSRLTFRSCKKDNSKISVRQWGGGGEERSGGRSVAGYSLNGA